MKKAAIICGLLFMGFTPAKAQSNYAANLIPPVLLTRAGAVIRNMEMMVKINDLDDVTCLVKQTITILNKSGEDQGRIRIWHNKTRQIKSIRAMFYDETGKPLRKFSEKDFEDVSAAQDYSLFEDSRMKQAFLTMNTYPYTLEYEYEIRSKQSMILPDWNPGNSPGVSVEYAKLTFSCKPDFILRYKEINYPGKVTITTGPDGNKTYLWELKNLKAFRDEPYSPDPEEYLPIIKLSPEKFSYQNIKGSFSNWEEYGRWTYEKLLKGRDQISQQTADYIKNLVKDIPDPKLKAKKIYEYVQQKNRYVSVQVGIGGYQPIPASEVDRVNYGDCKGLVNYTKALLNVVGIESYYVLVEAGNNKKSAIPDFASMDQFNHAILCIPFKNDTTWVDCTSKTLPFGYMGSFTDDRIAVACTKDGGKLIRTPKFSPEDSRQVRKANFVIDVLGNLNGEMITNFGGWQYENRDRLVDEPYQEQIKQLGEIYKFNNFDVQTFKIQQDKSLNPSTTELLKFNAKDYCSVNQNRLYMSLNSVNKTKTIKEVGNRVNTVYLNRGYTDIDELTYSLPENYRVDLLPRNLSIEKPFGTFSMNVEIKGNTVVYTRKLILNEGTYPPESYAELVDFYQKITDADESKISFVKR